MSQTINTIAIIQARMSSSRLPGKVLKNINEKPVLEYMIERVKNIKNINKILVATTNNDIDIPIIDLCRKMDVNVFSGDENDVLGRYYFAAKSVNADNIVRLTADCPMIEPSIVDEIIELFLSGEWDYVSNTVDRTYPDGLDAEIFSMKVLQEAYNFATHPHLREHVTLYINGKRPDLGKGNFSIGQLVWDRDFSNIRLTLDTASDLKNIRKLIELLPYDYNWHDVINFIDDRPELFESIR